MCTPTRVTFKEQKIFTFIGTHAQEAHAATSKDLCQWLGSTYSNPSNANLDSFTPMPSATIYIPRNSWVNHHSMILFHLQTSTMDALHYWPFAWEYSLWNAAVAALQFWTEDLEPHVLSHIIDWVYAAFFYNEFGQQMQNLPEEILFSHFVTTLNDAFEIELAQEDEGYESGSENFHIPTPLSRAPRVYDVSTVHDLSFYLTNFCWSPTTPGHHAESSPHRYRSHNITQHWLVFTSSENEPCKIQQMSQPAFQLWWQRLRPQGSRCFILHTPQLMSSPQTSSSLKYKMMIPPPSKTFPNSAIRLWCLGWRTNSR